MGFRQLLEQNVLLRWLARRGPGPELALSMAGVRLGERVAQVGLADGGLFVAMAGKVGYTGRVVGVDADGRALERARRAAERAGVLAELEQAPAASLPLEPGTFDLVVVLGVGSSVTPTAEVLVEALRALRPGGRCLAIAAGARSGRASGAHEDLVVRLRECGFKASRQLAERDGLAFFEATKTT